MPTAGKVSQDVVDRGVAQVLTGRPVTRVAKEFGIPYERLRKAARKAQTAGVAKAPQGDDLKVLKLALDDIQRENQRLREARSMLTGQLGPLPVSAALIAGLVAAFPGTHSGSAWQHRLTFVALFFFGLMVVLSMSYSALKPYRKLRDGLEEAAPDEHASQRRWEPADGSPAGIVSAIVERQSASRPDGSTVIAIGTGDEAAWYAAMIEVERKIRGHNEPWRRSARIGRVFKPRRIENLQQACDVEWAGLFIVKTLFVIVVALLITARFT